MTIKYKPITIYPGGEIDLHPALHHLDLEDLLDYTEEELQAMVDEYEEEALHKVLPYI
jgi:hypothetical protein